MQMVSTCQFLEHVATQGIALDSRYAEPRTLGYQNKLSIAIPMPELVLQRSQAISGCLGLFDDRIPVWVWRRGGVWRLRGGEGGGVRRDVDRAASAVFAMAGIDDKAEGAVYLDSGDKGLLYAMVFMNSLAAASVSDDLFVVPEVQGFVLWFDHDEQIILGCRDQETYDVVLPQIKDAMARFGIDVPF